MPDPRLATIVIAIMLACLIGLALAMSVGWVR